MDGGYDEGYRACPCFWGRNPGSLVTKLSEHTGSMTGLRVLDLGCGEGKNAAYFASRGCTVDAYDISEVAISRARATWPDAAGIRWVCDSVVDIEWPTDEYDVVIAYGLLHCLPSAAVIEAVLGSFRDATKPCGYNIIVAFNDRKQDLSAQPELNPCLLPHSRYLELCSGWEVLHASDQDLVETHPNNNIQHTHSMTRILVRKGGTS